MTTLQIEKGHRKLTVNTRRSARFWSRFSAGVWEPDTIRIITERVGKSTTYLDIGAWIGPTVLYAAQNSKVAYGFEPDPVAFEELKANVELNPHILNLSIYNVFVGTEDGRTRMGSRTERGDSQSSALFSGGSNEWEVPSTTLGTFAVEKGLCSPMFLKIDIEGGEYALMPRLLSFIMMYRPTILLSVHPSFLAMTVSGQGFHSKLRRRLKLILAHGRLARILNAFDNVTSVNGERVSLAGGVARVASGRRFVCGNTLLAWFNVSTAG